MMQAMMNMFAQQQGQPGQPGQNMPTENNSQFNPGTPPPNPFQNQPQNPPQEEKKKDDPKGSSEFQTLKKQGDQAYMSKKFKEAVEIYDKAIAIDEKQILVRNNKAACLIEIKQYEQALHTVEEAINVYKDCEIGERDYRHYAKVLARKARILHLQDKYVESIHQYELSLLEDNQPKIRTALRDLKREKIKKEKLAYIHPEKADEHREKGNGFFKQGNFSKAIEEYEEAIKRNPKDPKIYNNLASCFIKVMRYNDAMKQVEKVLELDPENIKALIRKGTIQDLGKEYHKAIKTFKYVLEKDPKNESAKRCL